MEKKIRKSTAIWLGALIVFMILAAIAGLLYEHADIIS